MTDTIRIRRDIHPAARLPDDKQTVVWRYMDRWKFKKLIEEGKLYLCRADKLQDKFEGTYSRVQLLEMNRWLEDKGCESIIADEAKRRRVNRKRFYISCWCMADHDLDLMWKAYTKDKRAVALQSRVLNLEAICDKAIDYWDLDVSTVKYFGHGEGQFIDYADGFSAFINKDYHFGLDKEIRIIHWSNYAEPPEFVFLPVDLSSLIERIVLAPGADSEHAETIRAFLDENGLKNVPVESSRDDRELMT